MIPYDTKSALIAALINSLKTCDAEIASDGGPWHRQFWADRRKDYAEAKSWLDAQPADWTARTVVLQPAPVMA